MVENAGGGSAGRRAAFRAVLGDGSLGRLFAYWERKAGDAAMPVPGAIDPIEIPDLLPQLYLLDVERGADDAAVPDFRFRLAGTGVRELFDREITGRRIADVLPEPDLLENAQRSYGTILRDGAPWLTDILYELEWGEPFRYRRLSLPLGPGDGRVTRILGAFDLDRPPEGRKPFHELLPALARTLERIERAG